MFERMNTITTVIITGDQLILTPFYPKVNLYFSVIGLSLIKFWLEITKYDFLCAELGLYKQLYHIFMLFKKMWVLCVVGPCLTMDSLERMWTGSIWAKGPVTC